MNSVMEPVVDLEGRRVAQQGRFVVRPKILIIDDSVDTWNLLSTIVKSYNYYPVWAADGMQAVAAARFHHPQAILLDLGLPGGDGFLILQRLKSNHLLSEIPVIVVTIRDRKEAEEKAFVATDDASIMEWMDTRVVMVEGDYSNVKITTPEDLLMAEAILRKRRMEHDSNRTRF